MGRVFAFGVIGLCGVRNARCRPRWNRSAMPGPSTRCHDGNIMGTYITSWPSFSTDVPCALCRLLHRLIPTPVHRLLSRPESSKINHRALIFFRCATRPAGSSRGVPAIPRAGRAAFATGAAGCATCASTRSASRPLSGSSTASPISCAGSPRSSCRRRRAAERPWGDVGRTWLTAGANPR
jgi:hypothetical protein